MIDWAIKNATEPPLTFNLLNRSLMKYVNEISTPNIELENYPCHTQAVETCIKLVSEASERVCGLTKRDGLSSGRTCQPLKQKVNTSSRITECMNTEQPTCINCC